MKLGVIIVTFNRLELLKECINACLNQTYKFKEIFIFNNASTDGTKSYLDSLKNNKITISHSKENLGGAFGFYEGVRHFEYSDLDYVLLIDDDAILDKNYNYEIIKYMKNLNDICCFSGTVKTNDKIQYEHRRHLKNRKKFKENFSNEKEYSKEYFDYELSTFCGLFIPVNLIKKIKYPSKEFFIWFDDTEYSLRLLNYGKIRNINSAFLNHKTNLNNKSGHNWKSYYSLRNRIIVLKRHFSRWELFKYLISLRIKLLELSIVTIVKKDAYYKIVFKMYKDAIKDGTKEILGKNIQYTPQMKFPEKHKI